VTLATDGVIGANGGPRSPGTAYILLHHCMGGVAGHRGLWGFVRGGMGAVSEAIAASARASGARFASMPRWRRCWCAADARGGVVLENGEEIEAAGGSNLDPKMTFLKLVERTRTSTGDFVAPSGDFRIEGTAAKSIWR
jgi:phytoene dehydrogenase-like protein